MSSQSRFLKLSTIFIFLVTGCGVSPLFNHRNADDMKSPSVALTDDCQLAFTKAGLCASLTWTKHETEDEPGAFTLRFWKKGDSAKGPFVDPGRTVKVKLVMPGCPMVPGPVKVAGAKDASGAALTGVFDATEVRLGMAGDWEIWIQLKEGTQVFDQAKIDYHM